MAHDRTRRGSKPQVDGFEEEARKLNEMIERDAQNLVDTLAPERPIDTLELEEEDQLAILERVAISLPISSWDNPDALEDLARLTLKLRGQEFPGAKSLAKLARTRKQYTPDPSLAPGNEEFEKQARRMAR